MYYDTPARFTPGAEPLPFRHALGYSHISPTCFAISRALHLGGSFEVKITSAQSPHLRHERCQAESEAFGRGGPSSRQPPRNSAAEQVFPAGSQGGDLLPLAVPLHFLRPLRSHSIPLGTERCCSPLNLSYFNQTTLPL